MTNQVVWQPYKEPLWVTLARTGVIAIVVGGILAWQWGGAGRWPLASLLVFWPSFGGHWVEVFFLNVLRPQLPPARAVHVAARLVVWFGGGILLASGMLATAMLASVAPEHWISWWKAGLGFVIIELLVHLAMNSGGRPNFYNGRG